MKKVIMGSISLAVLLTSCNQSDDTIKNTVAEIATFGEDLAFFTEHAEVVVLSDEAGQAQVVVSPAMQGRVLTSTAAGSDGMSYGWINRELISSGERQEHINVFGGEDRFWLGPEGGQFSIFFQGGDPFEMEHWYVPPAIDWDPFPVVAQERDRIVFEKAMRLKNYSGTTFDLEVDREVRLSGRAEVAEGLGVALDSVVQVVAFESVNTITNVGNEAWTREGGLLSIWILGMFTPSPATTIVIPYQSGDEEARGPIVNAAYFGEPPPDRLIIEDDVVYFRGDGEYRGKIGLTSKRSKSVFGSYDADNRVLTLVQYTMSEKATDYVNSMWEIQEDPYAGDIINSYNDGPPEPGAEPLGPFYELESSSPAVALVPGESLTHVHRTIHLQGNEEALDRIAVGTLGKTVNEIRSAFAP